MSAEPVAKLLVGGREFLLSDGLVGVMLWGFNSAADNFEDSIPLGGSLKDAEPNTGLTVAEFGRMQRIIDALRELEARRQ